VIEWIERVVTDQAWQIPIMSAGMCRIQDEDLVLAVTAVVQGEEAVEEEGQEEEMASRQGPIPVP
jgi:hypothetical protein